MKESLNQKALLDSKISNIITHIKCYSLMRKLYPESQKLSTLINFIDEMYLKKYSVVIVRLERNERSVQLQ